jgi:hypothetical protein
MNNKNFLTKMINKVRQKQKGQATLTMVLALLSTTTVIVVALGFLTFSEVKKLNNVVKSAQSYYAAEAGVEDAILRVKDKMSYTNSYTLAVGDGTAQVDLTGPLDDLTIISGGNVFGRIRKVAVNIVAEPSSENVDFNYGVQVGDGGLIMKANSQVSGGVYSNGPIEGPAGVGAGNIPIILGDAFSAEAAGSDGISKINVQLSAPGESDGNAHANTIRDVTADGTLYCVTGSGNNKPCDLSEPDPDKEDLPVTDSQISSWESWALAGGETGPVTIAGGATQTLGPIKINGDLVIESNATLVVGGTIWVTGNIDINSNSLVLLDSAYGPDSSGVVLASGKVDIESNVNICGSNGGTSSSCNPENGSYLMLVTNDPSTDDADPAMVADSNILTSVLYAHQGAIKLNSNVHVKEVTGYSLILESNATVTFETGLASVVFSSGPGGAFKINSWLEVE